MVKQLPYPSRPSICIWPESEQHDHEEHCIDGQNGHRANQTSVRLQDHARLNKGVVRHYYLRGKKFGIESEG